MTVVLAAIDDTAASRPVLQTAVEFARVLQAVPCALHAGPDSGYMAEKAAAVAGVPLIVVDTPAVAGVLARAQQPDVALVVLALHRQPIGPHTAGHTGLAVVAQISKPVLVVPPEEGVREKPRRALMPLDGTQVVAVAMRPVISLLSGAGIEIVGLHVFDLRTVPRFLDSAKDLQVWTDEFVARNCAGLEVRLELRAGDAGDLTLELASAEDVDVIVLGWRQDLAPHQASLVRQLLSAARRPVMLVPLPGAEET